jgi:pimeloyl-ACP methyl ester carboxylesterase
MVANDSQIIDGTPVEQMSGFEHRYAQVNGIRLHYVIGGEGPLIVLLHGWPFTWAEWALLMPLLATQGYRVVAPDLRGFGLSELSDQGYAKDNIACDVFELVRLLGEDAAVVVGTDIGGMVAYAYAARYPDAVRRLIIAETLLPGFGLEELMNPATGGYWHFGFHMQVELATMLTRGRESEYLLPMWKMMSHAADAEEQAQRYYLPAFQRPGAMRAGFKHYETLLDDGRHNQRSVLSTLTMPVLVLNGDKGIPHEQTLGSVQRAAANVLADVVPNAGHNFAHDNPEWVADRLRVFLA